MAYPPADAANTAWWAQEVGAMKQNGVTASYLYEQGWHPTHLKSADHYEIWHKEDKTRAQALKFDRTAQRVVAVETIK